MIFSADRRPETTGSQPGRCWARRGASWWTGQTPTGASGRKRQCAQSAQGAAELVLPGPDLGEMQGETASFAGDASGQGNEASPEGLGGGHRLAQPDAPDPACLIVKHRTGVRKGMYRGRFHRRLSDHGGPKNRSLGRICLPRAQGERRIPLRDRVRRRTGDGHGQSIGIRCNGIHPYPMEWTSAWNGLISNPMVSIPYHWVPVQGRPPEMGAKG